MAGRKQETQLRTAGGIQYELTRKRVKNLNIRVREDGTVAVSIPLRTSAEAADRFVAARADWVQQARERAMRRAAQEARPLPDKETALAYFTAMSDKVYPAFAGVLGGHKPTIKDQPVGRVLYGKAADHLCAAAVSYAPGGADLCGSA